MTFREILERVVLQTPGALAGAVMAADGIPIDELEREEPETVDVLQRVNGGDVRMVQRCQQLGFIFQTAQCLRIVGDLFRQHLDGNATIKTGVHADVHDSHSAAAQLSLNAILPDPFGYRALPRDFMPFAGSPTGDL